MRTVGNVFTGTVNWRTTGTGFTGAVLLQAIDFSAAVLLGCAGGAVIFLEWTGQAAPAVLFCRADGLQHCVAVL